MNNNNLIAVDILDNKLGIVTKKRAHEKGILHRAFSIFLYHDGKLLIQQRALKKYHSGGLWANTCCSHPRTENLIQDAKERLLEETGIKCDNLKELYTFNYFTKFSDKMFEYELDHVIVGKYSGNFNFNKREIMDMKWVSFEDLYLDLIKNPQKYASWFLICAPRVIEHLTKRKGK